MVPKALVTPLAILSWYGSNIGVLLLNKYVLSFYHFKYPVFLTFLHMVSCTVLSYLSVAMKWVAHNEVKSRQHFAKISFLAVVFCGSVVLGNVSLRFLPVSFNQAIGSTTPLFTAVLGFFILGTVESIATYMALIPVMLGIVIASGFEPSFHFWGFTACVGGTGARALKSVVQSLLLSHPEDKLDSINLLRYMAPVACAVLLPLSLCMEDAPYARAVEIGTEYPYFYFAIAVNCFLAFFVNLTNFLVTKYTGALTLQVLGNAKGVVAVAISILLFRNPVSMVALGGYGITVCGVIAYSEAKKRAKKAPPSSKVEINMENGVAEKHAV